MIDIPFTLYTKGECKFCRMAKELLDHYGYSYREQIIGIHIIREHFLELFPDSKTVPVIVHDGVKIGGYEDLREYLKTYTPKDLLQG